MNDKELLELAARAVGYRIVSWDEHLVDAPYVQDTSKANTKPFCWLPLTDPGDALRLAVALNIDMFWRTNINGRFIVAERSGIRFCPEAVNDDGTDALAATMRAITRAAAEIGRAKT